MNSDDASVTALTMGRSNCGVKTVLKLSSGDAGLRLIVFIIVSRSSRKSLCWTNVFLIPSGTKLENF